MTFYRLFAAVVISLMFAMPAMAQVDRPLPKPKILAVYFYSDYCAVCKVLSPELAQVTQDYADKEVLFITMDLTNKAKIHQSLMHASQLGLGDYVKQQGSATGYVALLTPNPLAEVARFDGGNATSASMTYTLQNLLRDPQ
tara:strand:- start:523 stop:945 length:423 start_codon:yes stop_codon:yes gene_type:complete